MDHENQAPPAEPTLEPIPDEPIGVPDATLVGEPVSSDEVELPLDEEPELPLGEADAPAAEPVVDEDAAPVVGEAPAPALDGAAAPAADDAPAPAADHDPAPTADHDPAPTAEGAAPSADVLDLVADVVAAESPAASTPVVDAEPAPAAAPRRRRAASRPAGPPVFRAATAAEESEALDLPIEAAPVAPAAIAPIFLAPSEGRTRRRSRSAQRAAAAPDAAPEAPVDRPADGDLLAEVADERAATRLSDATAPVGTGADDDEGAPARARRDDRRRRARARYTDDDADGDFGTGESTSVEEQTEGLPGEIDLDADGGDDGGEVGEAGDRARDDDGDTPRRRRRRGGRGRRRGTDRRDDADSEGDDEPRDRGDDDVDDESRGDRDDDGRDEAPADDRDGTDSEVDVDDADGTAPTGSRGGSRSRRRNRRGGDQDARRSGRAAADEASDGDSPVDPDADGDAEDGDDDAGDGDGGSLSTKRRRRRRRRGEDATDSPEPGDPPNTVVRVRERRDPYAGVTAIHGSTRVEAKRQRRRENRTVVRRQTILTESEFLARREAVERTMLVRQVGAVTEIAMLEDGVLVELYVDRGSQQSLIGNVYLGRVQNVLPSMEAAFIDIGRGRNAVLYAGEVDWAGPGRKSDERRIEQALSSGQTVLVQVTKDPIGHKGARLTGHVSLPGRFVVYVPNGSMSGISRKLSDAERARLRAILKDVVDDKAEVIVRTAAEGASEEDLAADVRRLRAQWESIADRAKNATAPSLLYAEPDMTVKLIRDLFNDDIGNVVVSGDDAWETVDHYVDFVAPALRQRLVRWTEDRDIFDAYRVKEQKAKALDRKVFLPSGGSLVIDRTEAMTVVDVNTGKFTGAGGNLEQTVTRNNLEAAEELVRQLRLRDIGGIIVIDFIDMVLESNRDLVLRRLVECLGRDRTRHQVAEVSSLGLVQMTRKRVGNSISDAYTTACTVCNGNGYMVHDHPQAAPREGGAGGGAATEATSTERNGGGRSSRSGRGRGGDGERSGSRSRRDRSRGGESSESGDGGSATGAAAPSGADHTAADAATD